LMPAKYQREISEIASALDIEHDMFRPVRKLSGGMRRKLEIMRALLHHPQVLFLDEPTTGLDVASRRSLWTYLDDLRQRQETTIVLTTHYLEEAETTDRILILNHGQVVAQGTPRQVKARFAGQSLELDADDRDALRGELNRLDARFTENGVFRIALDDRSAYDLVRAINTPLTVMQTGQTTLEDVYLRILASD
jgi:ABC-2 type transport system ATP-binding protein